MRKKVSLAAWLMRKKRYVWCFSRRVSSRDMGIQTAPAASLLCARLFLVEPFGDELTGLAADDFAPRSLRS